MAKDKFKTNLRMSIVPIVVLLGLSAWAVRQGGAEPTNRFEEAVEIMTRTGLSDLDEAMMTEGYYEGLLDVSKRTVSTGAGLLGMLGQPTGPPKDWKTIAQTEAVRRLDEFLGYDLKPDVDIPFKGDRLRTNRWGQRDKDYELEKPLGTCRIALVGTSVTMGSGVPVDATFPTLLEDRLNDDRACPAIERYEVINFSVPGHRLTQEMEMAIERALPFKPDVVLFTLDYLTISDRWTKHIAALVRDGRDLKYDFLNEVAAKTGLETGDEESVVASKAKAYRAEVGAGCIREVHAACEAAGAELVLLLLAQPKYNPRLRADLEEVLTLVADLDLPVIDALDAFEGRNSVELQIHPADGHPNDVGHRLLFETLYRRVQENPKLRRVLVDCGISTS